MISKTPEVVVVEPDPEPEPTAAPETTAAPKKTLHRPIPASVEPARALLQATADTGADLGWAFTGYGHTLSVSSFDGSVFESGRVEWDVSEDNTVRAPLTRFRQLSVHPSTTKMLMTRPSAGRKTTTVEHSGS